MNKKFTTFFILTFILGLLPANFADAITQNQIDAEVQIVCPDNYGNWYSGSGTIIDSKGIILTNKHVVTDKFGSIIKTCAVGFIESVNQEPNFGTSGNVNLAEVKYYTTSNDLDAAILYLENPTNKTYPYINIWSSNSNTLQLGDKIEVIGFPSIGGSTITYTSGDFSGFGSISDGTQNYVKTTAPLEHGNSGGAAYSSNDKFIGIPTMVVAGTLNSLSYVLSVDSIKNWLSQSLNQNYEQTIKNTEPNIQSSITNIKEDVTPPDFNNKNYLCYNIYNDDGSEIGARCFPKGLGKIEGFNNIQFIVYNSELYEIDESGLSKIYYYFDNKPHTQIDNFATEYTVAEYKSDRSTLSDKITIEKAGTYYFSFFAVDKNNNVSNPYVYEYVYEPESFKLLQTVNFYKDSNRKNFINSYSVNNNTSNTSSSVDKSFYGAWGYGANVCYTNQNNITLEWNYPTNYASYVVYTTNSYNNFPFQATGKITNGNKYTLSNLSLGKKVIYKEFLHDTTDQQGMFYEVYLKPYLSDSSLEHKHKFLSIVYDKNWGKDLSCVSSSTFSQSDQIPITPDINLANRLKGQILLQVEQNGEAYYIYPDDKKRYYLGRPKDAFEIMRKLGLGATHDFITSHTVYPTHVSGKILLDVEQNGEAYYIYPKDRKAYYLGRPTDAFRIMRELGLGITNTDIRKIDVGEIQ